MGLSSEIRTLLDDVSYLQDELEALKTVITAVPYAERPPGSVSILDVIAQLQEQQERYYRPLIEAIKTGRDSSAKVQTVDDDFRIQDSDADVNSILNEAIKKRADYSNLLRDLPEEDWSQSIETPDGVKKVTELVREHIEYDRSQLKSIAERVMALDQTRSAPQH